MRFRFVPVLAVFFAAVGVGAHAQDPEPNVEQRLRERVALLLAGDDAAGALRTAELSTHASSRAAKMAALLLLAELHFRADRRADALRIAQEWRTGYAPELDPQLYAPGDLVEVLGVDYRVLERGIIGNDGWLWKVGERRIRQLGFQDPKALDKSVEKELLTRYGAGVQLRAWRTEKHVLGVPPQAAPAQDDANTQAVREHFQKLNLPSLGYQDHSRMEALRRMGPAAIEAAMALWMGSDERDPVRRNAVLYVAQEAPQRLREALPSLRESTRSAAASALLHGMAQSEGIPPALLRDEFREGWLGLLDSPDGSVRSDALFLVDRAYPAEVASRLERLAKDPDALLRQRVSQQLLPRLAWDERVEGVARGMLRDADAVVRQHVVRLLGERRVLRAADALAVLREDASVDVRGMIFREGFPLVGAREEVEQLLLQGLQDANAQVSLYALDQLSRGACRTIANEELVAQLSRFAMQSDEHYCLPAMRSILFIAPESLGPVLEDLLRTVSPRTWSRAGVLQAWILPDAVKALKQASLCPSVWLDRRPWFLREQGLGVTYDAVLLSHIIGRIPASEIASWFALAQEEGDLTRKILGRAARVAPETLEAILRDPKAEVGFVGRTLAALGDDPRGIAWVARDPRWRDHPEVLKALGHLSSREDARGLLAAWLEKNLGPEQATIRASVLNQWIPKLADPVSNLPMLPLVARALWHITDNGGFDSSVLFRVHIERVIEALEATRPEQVTGEAWSAVHNLVAPRAGGYAAVQDFWVRWFAPRCAESASMAKRFGLDPSRLKSASSHLAELYRSWSKADAPHLRSQACHFFGRGLVSDARDRLIAALRDPATEVCTAAAQELRHFDDAASVEALLVASTAESPDLRDAAAKSLEVLRTTIEAKRFWSTIRAEGLEDPLAKILPMIRGTDPELRLLAIDSLGALGSPRALPHLLELFQSGGAPEKAAAKRAIERIQRAVDAERAKAVESGAKPAPGGEKESGDSSKKNETEGGGGGS